MQKNVITWENLSVNLRAGALLGLIAAVAYAVFTYTNIVSIQGDHEKRITIVETNYTAVNRSMIQLENQVQRIDERTILILEELRSNR